MIDFERLKDQRQQIFRLIDKEIEFEPHHKSYEGAIDVSLGNRWDEDGIYITLHCYVAPARRHHNFKSLDELQEFIDDWLKDIECREHSQEGFK